MCSKIEQKIKPGPDLDAKVAEAMGECVHKWKMPNA